MTSAQRISDIATALGHLDCQLGQRVGVLRELGPQLADDLERIDSARLALKKLQRALPKLRPDLRVRA